MVIVINKSSKVQEPLAEKCTTSLIRDVTHVLKNTRTCTSGKMLEHASLHAAQGLRHSVPPRAL